MIKRPAHCACWILCAASGLFLFRATISLAESESETGAPQRSRQTTSRTSAPSAQPESEIQRQLRALYARDGREMPDMHFPPARQAASSAEERRDANDADDADEAAEEAEEARQESEAQRGVNRTPQQNGPMRQKKAPEKVAPEEVEKPSLMKRLNPFKGRSQATPPVRQPSYKSRETHPYQEQVLRRQDHALQELQPETPDTHAADSTSRRKFLPSFLRRREPELPKQPPAHRAEESLAGRPRRSVRPENPVGHDEDRAAPRAIRREASIESLVEDVPKQAPPKAAGKNPDDWIPPWEIEAQPVAHRPLRENHQGSPAKESRALESPFAPANDLADLEPARKPAETTPRSQAKEKIAVSATEGKVSPKTSAETKVAAKPAEAEKSARLPVQEDFPNPFTEVTEKDADKRGHEILDDHPFTGLKLGEEKLAETHKPRAVPKEDPKVETTVDLVKKESESKLAPLAPQPKADAAPKVLPVAEAATVADGPKKSELAKVAEAPKKPEASKIADRAVPQPFRPEKAARLPGADDPLQQAKMRRLSTRRGLAGLKGFCPVALRDNRDLVDTKAEFMSTHEGRLYQFSSVEAKETFDAEPEKYVPAMNGVDVIIQANSHQSVDGTLDHAVWFRDRLYLFSSSESLEAFVLNPTEYSRD